MPFATSNGRRLPFLAALLSCSLGLALPPDPPAPGGGPVLSDKFIFDRLRYGGSFLDPYVLGHFTYALQPYLERATDCALGPLYLDHLVPMERSAVVYAEAAESRRHFLVHLDMRPQPLAQVPHKNL